MGLRSLAESAGSHVLQGGVCAGRVIEGKIIGLPARNAAVVAFKEVSGDLDAKGPKLRVSSASH